MIGGLTEDEARTRAFVIANERPGERIEVMRSPDGTRFLIRSEATRTDRAMGAWIGMSVHAAIVVNADAPAEPDPEAVSLW